MKRRQLLELTGLTGIGVMLPSLAGAKGWGREKNTKFPKTTNTNKKIEVEILRTAPDYIVYVPKSVDGHTRDTGNEHFLVFKMSNGILNTVWTQSSYEGKPDQRIVFSYSQDEGKTWAAPKVIAGPDASAGQGMASWGFPIVSNSGRIYVIYNRHIGVNDIFSHTTGRMACVYSDDNGRSWSKEQFIPMPRSIWDNPDTSIPANWIVWQRPQRISQDKYFVGFTRWISPAVRPPAPMKIWWAESSVVEFMRFENIDQDPEPVDIEISYFMSNENALQVGLIGHPEVSVVQEPSIVELPDGRLFCIFRTTVGNPYYSVSEDQGETWRKPEPLRQNDGGSLLLHPCSPCPIYQVDRGEYIFFYHNHDGHFLRWTPKDTTYHRRPICLAHGQFQAKAHQPIWFSDPWYFMDNGGVAMLRTDLAMYASVTPYEDGVIFWYPDRKFFLLGKKIPRDLVYSLPIRI